VIGRKLTPERVKRIVEMADSGVSRDKIAAGVMMSRSQLYLWLATGRKERKRREKGGEPDEGLDDLVDLVSLVEAAEARLMERCVRRIDAAAESGTWQAAAWLLERKWPDHFGANRAEIVRELRDLRKALMGKGD
jgi:hypothetical protein